MLETRLYSFGGFTAVAPVHWASPEQSVQRGSSTTRVKWGDLYGWAFHTLARGEPPLAFLIASTLPDDMAGATLVAVEDSGASLWYAAVFREGMPVEGTEVVFDDPKTFENHLRSLARSAEIQHCALTKALAERLPDLWDTPTIIEPGLIRPEAAPAFASPLTLSPRAIKAIKIAVTVLFVSSVVGAGAWAAFAPEAERAPVFVTVHKAKSVKTFVAECSAGLSSDWPQPLNWDLVTTGCFDDRLSPNTDAKGATTEAGVFRTYKLNSGFNVQNARIIARHALSNWETGEHIFADTVLTLIIPFENPIDYVDQSSSAASPLIDGVEEVFVGTVESIRVNPTNGVINIRTETTPQQALERVMSVPGAEVRAIKTTGNSTEMLVAPLTVTTLQEVAKR